MCTLSLSLPPGIFIVCSPNLFPNLRQPLGGSKWPGVARVREPLLKACQRLGELRPNMSASAGTRFVLRSSAHGLHAFTSVAFAVGGVTAKLARISFSFFTTSQMEDSLPPEITTASSGDPNGLFV